MLGARKGPAEKGEKTKWFCPVRSSLPFTGIAFAENLLLVRGLELKGRRARARITSGRKNTAPAIPFVPSMDLGRDGGLLKK